MGNYLSTKAGPLVFKVICLFQTAYTFLEQHPQIMGSRIAMWGLSFGSAMTFKMAVYSKVMKLRCAVIYSGSHVQPVHGGLKEIMEYILKNQDKTRFSEKQELIWHDLLLPIPKDPAFKVDMGRLQCPLLLAVGLDDQNWPAYESAMDIKEMMEKAGNSHLLTLLMYPKTGHLIEPPYAPLARSGLFLTPQAKKAYMTLWGGEIVPHSWAQKDAWTKTLLFLKAHLYS